MDKNDASVSQKDSGTYSKQSLGHCNLLTSKDETSAHNYNLKSNRSEFSLKNEYAHVTEDEFEGNQKTFLALQKNVKNQKESTQIFQERASVVLALED